MIETDERFDINYIDPSGLSTFSRCPAKYMFERQMGLVHPDASSISTDYGTVMHKVLPVCYQANEKIEEVVERAVEVFKKEWAKYSYGEDDELRNTELTIRRIEDFAERRNLAACPYRILKFPFEAVTEDVVSSNEVPFLIDIGGALPLEGRIDAPVFWIATAELYALDYKTSRELSPRYFNNFHNSPQACGYTLALSHISGKDVTGMIVEGIRVSKRDFEVQLGFTHVFPHQIERFINFANMTADEILLSNKIGKWETKPTGCAPYSCFGFPSFYCPYKEICDCPDWRDTARFYDKKEPFHPFKIKEPSIEKEKKQESV